MMADKRYHLFSLLFFLAELTDEGQYNLALSLVLYIMWGWHHKVIVIVFHLKTGKQSSIDDFCHTQKGFQSFCFPWFERKHYKNLFCFSFALIESFSQFVSSSPPRLFLSVFPFSFIHLLTICSLSRRHWRNHMHSLEWEPVDKMWSMFHVILISSPQYFVTPITVHNNIRRPLIAVSPELDSSLHRMSTTCETVTNSTVIDSERHEWDQCMIGIEINSLIQSERKWSLHCHTFTQFTRKNRAKFLFFKNEFGKRMQFDLHSCLLLASFVSRLLLLNSTTTSFLFIIIVTSNALTCLLVTSCSFIYFNVNSPWIISRIRSTNAQRKDNLGWYYLRHLCSSNLQWFMDHGRRITLQRLLWQLSCHERLCSTLSRAKDFSIKLHLRKY